MWSVRETEKNGESEGVCEREIVGVCSHFVTVRASVVGLMLKGTAPCPEAIAASFAFSLSGE